MTREVLLVAHTGRPAALHSAAIVARRLAEAGISLHVLGDEAQDLNLEGVSVQTASDGVIDRAEIVLVLGGDGTLLRAAELVRKAGTPLLGVNLGQVGFLAEAEREALTSTVDRLVEKRYDVEERMTVDVAVHSLHGAVQHGWALNEVAVEKDARERMLEVVVEIDGRPLSRWAGDGVVFATPTGSTAYAFSAGGPVVWPEVDALLLVPISAHALFARPLVTSPHSVLAVEVLPESPNGVVWCDGRRRLDITVGSRVEVTRGSEPVRFARLHHRPFTDRLVAKFGLPVQGWRGHGE
ncbi:MAG: kinase [Frankiales bacterium]|jgi:NAD+ kinase|nr:kinase [Frankiales bacterium]